MKNPCDECIVLPVCDEYCNKCNEYKTYIEVVTRLFNNDMIKDYINNSMDNLCGGFLKTFRKANII